MTTTVQSVLDALAALENDNGGFEAVANAFLDGDEFVLQMNEAAAIQLCRLILEITSKGFAGAHQHLDDTNFVDAGGGRLRIETIL